MSTTLLIKLDKGLREEAKRTAQELGIPLTTVVAAYLKQFVRERKITISLDPTPTKAKLALFERISREMDKEIKTPKQ